jgi:hypothetical protein
MTRIWCYFDRLHLFSKHTSVGFNTFISVAKEALGFVLAVIYSESVQRYDLPRYTAAAAREAASFTMKSAGVRRVIGAFVRNN